MLSALLDFILLKFTFPETVYAVNIRKTRHAVPVGLIADGAAMIVAVWVVRLLFG